MKPFRLFFSFSVLSFCATLAAQDLTIPANDPSVDVVRRDALMEKASVLLHAPTKTTLTVLTSGTLGDPVTFNATVRTKAAAGSPQGTIYLVDRTNIVGQFDVSPTNSLDPRFAYSVGTYTITNEAGSHAYYFGKHTIRAQFYSPGIYNRSTGDSHFTVIQPVYTEVTNGVNIATVIAGSGAPATNGQQIAVLYSGYLAKNGKVFDYSDLHGGLTLDWTLGGPRVIPGFNEGILGMLNGETRIIQIPPKEGYGTNGIPSRVKGQPPIIPPNATLIFLVQLVPPT